MVNNNYRDKFIFNNFGAISPTNIVSVNYENSYVAANNQSDNLNEFIL